MNLMKIGAGLVIAIVVVMIGMNQYESYKLTSRANNAIESIEDTQRHISNLKAMVAIINVAVQNDRQRKLLENQNSNYIDSISSSDTILFDKVLTTPIKAGTSEGEWSKYDNVYDYNLGDAGLISFIYDNKNGTFKCFGNCILFPDY